MSFFTKGYRSVSNYLDSRLPNDLQFGFEGTISCSSLPRLIHAKLSRTVTPYEARNKAVPNEPFYILWLEVFERCNYDGCSSRLSIPAYQGLSRPFKIADDLLQPIWGVVHLLTAAAYVVAVPFHVLESIYQVITDYKRTKVDVLLKRTLVWLIYAIENVLCGAIELVTTPLTYFYRMPLRLLLTAAGENNQSTGLTVGSALLVTGGMTLALWTGFAHFFPTLAGAAQQAINDLGAQAMPIIQKSLLGMAAAGAAIALISLATTHCKKQPASDEGQGEGRSLTSGGR